MDMSIASQECSMDMSIVSQECNLDMSIVSQECSLDMSIVRHFRRRHFRCIFVNEMFCILIEISMKFVPKVSIKTIPALV